MLEEYLKDKTKLVEACKEALSQLIGASHKCEIYLGVPYRIKDLKDGDVVGYQLKDGRLTGYFINKTTGRFDEREAIVEDVPFQDYTTAAELLLFLIECKKRTETK